MALHRSLNTSHWCTPTVHWEYTTSYIYVVEAKRFTPRVKHIDIPVCSLQGKIDNGIFVPKYEKSSVMLENVCTKQG